MGSEKPAARVLAAYVFGWRGGWALEELARYAGTEFDSELARLFIDQVRDDVELRDRLVVHRASRGSLDLRAS